MINRKQYIYIYISGHPRNKICIYIYIYKLSILYIILPINTYKRYNPRINNQGIKKHFGHLGKKYPVCSSSFFQYSGFFFSFFFFAYLAQFSIFSCFIALVLNRHQEKFHHHFLSLSFFLLLYFGSKKNNNNKAVNYRHHSL